jgi:hypothetical protein
MIEIGLFFNKMSLILIPQHIQIPVIISHFTDLGIKINRGSQVLTIGRGQHCKQFAIKTLSPFGFSHTLYLNTRSFPYPNQINNHHSYISTADQLAREMYTKRPVTL